MKPIQIEGCGHYHIDTFGVVVNTRTNRVLKPDLTNMGYRRVVLWNGERNRMAIHRLVAMTYIPNPDNLPMVNHKDGNKLNNHYSNLEWCTCSENTRHAFATGLRNLNFRYVGPAHNRSLSDEQVREIRKLKEEGWSRRDIVAKVGCSVDAYKRVSKYYKHVD